MAEEKATRTDKRTKKDLSQLEQIRKEECNRRRIKSRLETKYKNKRKSLTVVMDELKQRITTTTHRLIIFLPFIWKLLTGIISEELYGPIERHDLFPDGQRGSCKNSNMI